MLITYSWPMAARHDFRARAYVEASDWPAPAPRSAVIGWLVCVVRRHWPVVTLSAVGAEARRSLVKAAPPARLSRLLSQGLRHRPPGSPRMRRVWVLGLLVALLASGE